MISLEASDQQLPPAELFGRAMAALREKKFALGERLLAAGMATYPVALDAYEDPMFRKELIRHLVQQQRWEEAEALVPPQDGKSGALGWHYILFARALDKVGRKDDALAYWKRFADTRPWHTEAAAALAGLSQEQYQTRLAQLPEPLKLIKQKVPTQKLDIIFDVGANVGQSCVPYAKALPDAAIYAFEPAPESFRKLSEVIKGQKGVSIHNVALSSGSGSVKMVTHGDSTMNRIETASNKGNITIHTSTLEEFCAANRVVHIDFLKIDTEGHDLSVLQGCGRMIEHVDFVQCEASANAYNKFHNSFIDIFNFMTCHGFYLFHIDGQTFEWGGGGYPVLRRFDPIFVNSRVFGEMTGVTRE